MNLIKYTKLLRRRRYIGLCIIILLAIKAYYLLICDFEARYEKLSSMDIKYKQLLYASLELIPPLGINCSRIIRGDVDAIYKAFLKRIFANKHIPFTEDQYINLTTDCMEFKKVRKYITFPLSQEEEAFPIAYSMVIHNKIEMFERLLRAIYMPQNIYCVHVDEKSPEKFKEAVKAITSCFNNVFVASKLEKVVYASWSRVQADLNCMEELLRRNVQWKYLLNTCGTDFPIKTNAEMVKALTFLNGRNSMESEKTPPQKLRRWMFQHVVNNSVFRTEIRKGPPPDSITMFSGNAYNVMVKDFVKELFTDPRVRRFFEWEKDTFSPDEHLWATLHRLPGFPGSVPRNSKYDTSDLQAIARIVKWDKPGDMNYEAEYKHCHGVYRLSVCVYGTGDLPWILQQHHLLANKFDSLVNNNAIQCLEQYIRHKTLYGTHL